MQKIPKIVADIKLFIVIEEKNKYISKLLKSNKTKTIGIKIKLATAIEQQASSSSPKTTTYNITVDAEGN